MPVLYTIGFRQKSLPELIRLLRVAGVDAVIDVRLRNSSQLAGYTKRGDFEFLLREGFGMGYEHRPELAPTDEMLDAYRQDGNWPAYERAFRLLLSGRQAHEVGREVLNAWHAPCLLCAEPTADQCHRRLVAEYWAERGPDLTVVHL